MRTKSNNFFILGSLLLIILGSCAKGEVYSCFHHIGNGEWHRDSLLLFRIDSLDPISTIGYDVTLELTTNRGYPYRDLWLRIDQNLMDSLVRSDTLRCLLADEHGRWMGSGTGGLNQITLPYRSFVPRDSVYHYRLTIRQIMEDELLRGVEKVGIKVIRSDSLNH